MVSPQARQWRTVARAWLAVLLLTACGGALGSALTGCVLTALYPAGGQFEAFGILVAAVFVGAPYGAMLAAAAGYGRFVGGASGVPWPWRRVAVVCGIGAGTELVAVAVQASGLVWLVTGSGAYEVPLLVAPPPIALLAAGWLTRGPRWRPPDAGEE